MARTVDQLTDLDQIALFRDMVRAGAIAAAVCGLLSMRESAQDHPVWKTMDAVETPTTTELSVIRKVGPTSSRVTNSRSDWASSRCGGNPSESGRVGSAQSVHSRATLKLPRSNSRRISVSTPAMCRFLSTSKRWPRSGWKG